MDCVKWWTSFAYTDPVIDVHVPYEPGKANFGAACNRIMEETKHEWVLLLDHDVLLLHEKWYVICQEAIRTLSSKTSDKIGWISAVTNYSPLQCQLSPGCPQSTDISDHVKWAHESQKRNRAVICACNDDYAGFFMLTNKEAWIAAGGFRNDFFIDVDYSRKLAEAGYKKYILPGLYAWHNPIGKRYFSWQVMIPEPKTAQGYRIK